jgi:O-antigen/teichoic acid export membrane protein
VSRRPRGARGAGAQVLKNTIALVIARVVERGATLVLALLIASSLGADGLGAYSIALAFYGAISLMGESGTTMYLIRELARQPGQTGAYVVHLSVIALAVSALLTAAALLAVPQLGYSSEVTTGVSIVVLAILGRTLNSIQEAVFVAHGRTELETITTLLTTTAYVAASAWLLHRGHGVTALLAAYVVVEYVATAIYFVLIARCIAPLPWRTFRWPLARRLLGEIKSFAGSSFLAALLARPEIIVLSLLVSTREVGYYSAAVRIAEVWTFVPQVFMNNIYPLLSRAFRVDDGRFYAIQQRAIRAVLAYTLPLTGGLLAAAPQIVPALFGDAFAPAVDMLRVLGVNITFYGLTSLFWRSLAARDRQDVVLKVQILMIGCRIGGCAALVAALGAIGAAYAASASSAISFLLLAAATRRTGVATPSPLVAWRFAAAAGAMAAAIVLLAPVLPLAALVALAAAVYGVATIALRAFEPADLALLRASASRDTAVAP